MRDRPRLWRCQKCGRAFANRKQSHACGRFTLAHHSRGKPPAIRGSVQGGGGGHPVDWPRANSAREDLIRVRRESLLPVPASPTIIMSTCVFTIVLESDPGDQVIFDDEDANASVAHDTGTTQRPWCPALGRCRSRESRERAGLVRACLADRSARDTPSGPASRSLKTPRALAAAGERPQCRAREPNSVRTEFARSVNSSRFTPTGSRGAHHRR
jgi:hypothetical protein